MAHSLSMNSNGEMTMMKFAQLTLCAHSRDDDQRFQAMVITVSR
jgi:hypothetical protein